ncbi:hypothetical protein LDENG_00209120, partial [Lucifuga dentata]
MFEPNIFSFHTDNHFPKDKTCISAFLIFCKSSCSFKIKYSSDTSTLKIHVSPANS